MIGSEGSIRPRLKLSIKFHSGQRVWMSFGMNMDEYGWVWAAEGMKMDEWGLKMKVTDMTCKISLGLSPSNTSKTRANTSPNLTSKCLTPLIPSPLTRESLLASHQEVLASHLTKQAFSISPKGSRLNLTNDTSFYGKTQNTLRVNTHSSHILCVLQWGEWAPYIGKWESFEETKLNAGN